MLYFKVAICTVYYLSNICSKSFVSSTFYFQISSKFDPYNLYEMERMKFYEKKHRVKLARLSVTYNPTSIIFNASYVVTVARKSKGNYSN